MFTVTTEEVSFCFMKSPNRPVSLGIKYYNWLFYVDKFVSSSVEQAKDQLDLWLKNKNSLRIVLEIDGGFYLCEHRDELETVKASIALSDLCKQMWISNSLKKRLHHRSWRFSEKCFVARDVTDWIADNLKISQTDAVIITEKCVERDLFSHVNQKNKLNNTSQELYRLRKDLKISKFHKLFISSQ